MITSHRCACPQCRVVGLTTGTQLDIDTSPPDFQNSIEASSGATVILFADKLVAVNEVNIS